jgi:hypothetical protein
MTKNKGTKVDFKAEPCSGQDDVLKCAMMNLRKSRKPREAAMAKSSSTNDPQPGGPEPHKSKAKTRASTKVVKQAKPKGLQDEVSEEKFDLKGQLTLKELRFIEFYLTGDVTVDKAMESAGYVGYHKKSLYRLSRKIVEKYESSAGDHRKIMRAMGYGETKAIEMLIDSAENAKSEMVRLTARITLAKCLGLHQDFVAVNQGIQIIIKGREPVEHAPGRPAQGRQVPARSLPATMAITK